MILLREELDALVRYSSPVACFNQGYTFDSHYEKRFGLYDDCIFVCQLLYGIRDMLPIILILTNHVSGTDIVYVNSLINFLQFHSL